MPESLQDYRKRVTGVISKINCRPGESECDDTATGPELLAYMNIRWGDQPKHWWRAASGVLRKYNLEKYLLRHP